MNQVWYNSTMKNTISATLDANAIQALTQTLQQYAITTINPHVTHAFKTEDTTILVYTTKKVVFQGESAELLAQRFIPKKPFIPHAGSDEVGTGDYFGPVVVCACVCDEAVYTQLLPYTIMDSKLMDDQTMISLYHRFKDQVAHALMIVPPSKYNHIHLTYNMNAIKAKLHYEAFIALRKKAPLPPLCVIDQFTPKDSFYAYLNLAPDPDLPLHFETKAESRYLGVALASIFARAVFVLSLAQLETHYGCTLPKGASATVENAARVFIQHHGKDALKHVAKLHFKNTQRILNVQVSFE